LEGLRSFLVILVTIGSISGWLYYKITANVHHAQFNQIRAERLFILTSDFFQ